MTEPHVVDLTLSLFIIGPCGGPDQSAIDF